MEYNSTAPQSLRDATKHATVNRGHCIIFIIGFLTSLAYSIRRVDCKGRRILQIVYRLVL